MKTFLKTTCAAIAVLLLGFAQQAASVFGTSFCDGHFSTRVAAVMPAGLVDTVTV